MLLDRASYRIEATVILSVALHLALLSWFFSRQTGPAARRLELTEVEYQEEQAKPTEVEKLLNRLSAPVQAPAKAAPETAAGEAITELAKTSFQKVVGLKEKAKADDITDMDLTRLAAIPKLDLAQAAPAPALQPPVKRIALVRSEPSELQALQSKVVPLEEALPPADFGAEINRRNFQQPEAIIKQVKTERRAQPQVIDQAKRLSLQRDATITGEVRNRELLHREDPEVPRWLEEKGVEAEVVISFVVNPDGEVGDKLFVEKTSGYAELDRLAMAALKKFLFAPLPLNARQVEQKGAITIRFAFLKK